MKIIRELSNVAVLLRFRILQTLNHKTNLIYKFLQTDVATYFSWLSTKRSLFHVVDVFGGKCCPCVPCVWHGVVSNFKKWVE
jgi:hypothetical protein